MKGYVLYKWMLHYIVVCCSSMLGSMMTMSSIDKTIPCILHFGGHSPTVTGLIMKFNEVTSHRGNINIKSVPITQLPQVRT